MYLARLARSSVYETWLMSDTDRRNRRMGGAQQYPSSDADVVGARMGFARAQPILRGYEAVHKYVRLRCAVNRAPVRTSFACRESGTTDPDEPADSYPQRVRHHARRRLARLRVGGTGAA